MTQEDPHIRFETDLWVDKYSDYLYRYALMRTRNPTVAEDMVQETFLAAIKNLDQFDGRVDVKYWLRGILRNKTVDHIRKSVRRKKLQEEQVHDVVERFLFKHSGVPTTRPKPWAFDPDAAFAQEEFWEAFRSCIDKLKDPLKTAFTLKMLEDQETEEICKELDVSDNYLWVILHRARAQLKECLETNWTVS
ncbi:MAG: sigma-70 family RNA polymerase sigma factor [Verrucomicrobia bacterium]|nr:sigma-70 family RNA polymerase sigma factor [Verrucomicrobiota bacterium]MCH8514184.1 sigma-70 family RNA polymerase sigma factor [Kiritimatiellia bacterium]